MSRHDEYCKRPSVAKCDLISEVLTKRTESNVKMLSEAGVCPRCTLGALVMASVAVVKASTQGGLDLDDVLSLVTKAAAKVYGQDVLIVDEDKLRVVDKLMTELFGKQP